jgi:hypothetical protein
MAVVFNEERFSFARKVVKLSLFHGFLDSLLNDLRVSRKGSCHRLSTAARCPPEEPIEFLRAEGKQQ